MNPNEIGTGPPGTIVTYGYVYEGIAGYLSHVNIPNTVPLYRYWQPTIADHFYTTNANEIGNNGNPGLNVRHGYVYEGITGYIGDSKKPNNRAFYRYWNPLNTDHFYTANANELGNNGNPGLNVRHGYRYEGIAGYVFTDVSLATSSALENNENIDIIKDEDFNENDGSIKDDINGIYFRGVNVTKLVFSVIAVTLLFVIIGLILTQIVRKFKFSNKARKVYSAYDTRLQSETTTTDN